MYWNRGKGELNGCVYPPPPLYGAVCMANPCFLHIPLNTLPCMGIPSLHIKDPHLRDLLHVKMQKKRSY